MLAADAAAAVAAATRRQRTVVLSAALGSANLTSAQVLTMMLLRSHFVADAREKRWDLLLVCDCVQLVTTSLSCFVTLERRKDGVMTTLRIVR